ncbi:MAG: beta-lactamase family protein [Ruminococcaceae bacterium]|nr:beta-lactamase family protein [Oscillospiraceae bacterium]
MKRCFVFLLALLLLSASVLPLAAAAPQDSGVASVTVAIRDAVGKDTPGAALLLFENGERVMYEGYGYADIETRELVTAETLFELGELSSLFVTLAVAKLAEEGKLELDRDIAYYLPGDFCKELGLDYNITLNNLLSSRAGFADRAFDLRYENAALCFDTLQEALLADVPRQLAAPHAYTAYSPFGIALAAFVVECVAKMPYDAFVEETFLRPLGMTHTVLNAKNAPELKTAAGHCQKETGVFSVAAEKGRSYSALYPADGAISNIADLSVLLFFILNDEVGTEILSPGYRAMALERVFENGVFQSGVAGLSACGTARGMTAHTPHFSASLAFDRAAGKAALVLVNAPQSAVLALPARLCGLLEGIAVSPAGNLPDLRGFVGEYLPQGTAHVHLAAHVTKPLQVDAEGDKLSFGGRMLVQIAPGVFADANGDKGVAVVQFLCSVEGEVLYVLTARGEVYRPAGFTESNVVQILLLVLLWVGVGYFLIGAVLHVVDAVRTRRDETLQPRPWRMVIPWVLAATLALIVPIKAVALSLGGGLFASFMAATALIALCVALAAALLFIFALFTAFTERGMVARVARSAGIYLLFLLICWYWGVVSI